jgi:hypothetical protein
MTVELPAAPGRKARKAELSIKFGPVEIIRPAHRKASGGLPKTIAASLVVGRGIHPPEGEEPALWLPPMPHGSFASLGGWIGYYGKPAPIIMLSGLTQLHAIKHGRSLQNV